jgi:integrase
MYKGKAYTVVVDYKPTQKEAVQLMAKAMDHQDMPKTSHTFESAAAEYVKMKENILSPATIREYKRYPDRYPKDFVKMRLSDITPIDVQKMVNDLALDKSPKTVADLHGFASAVLRTFRPEMVLSTTLPERKKRDDYIPTEDDIKKMLERAKGGRYEIPLRLGCYGLRREEICALESTDVNGNILTINKALVEDENKKWIVKTTKKPSSIRTIWIDDELADMIRNLDGRVFTGYPGTIRNYLSREQDKLGLNHFSLHKFRHYYASISHAMGIPDSYIMASGGWKTDHVLKAVYRHALSDRTEEMQKQVGDYLRGLT